MSKRSAFVLLLLLTAAQYVLGQATISDEQVRAAAEDKVSKAMEIPRSALTTRRREDLDDSLFSFQRKIAGHIHRGGFFVEVVDGGYQVTPAEATFTPPTRKWLVAVSPDGKPYGLYGFPDALAAFNELVSSVGVDVRNESQAESFGRFCLAAVEASDSSILYDKLRLRHKAEEQFLGYMDSHTPTSVKEQQFLKWWRGFAALNVRNIAPQVVKTDSSYTVRFNLLQLTTGRTPSIAAWVIGISAGGTCKVQSRQTVYPIEGKQPHVQR